MTTETKERETEKAIETTLVPVKPNEWEWDTDLGMVKLSVDTVRRYFCAKATEAEIMHFMAVCKYHKLNPWLREAYLIKYQEGEAAQIVVGRDTHARRAEEHPQYAGDTGGIIVKKEDGTIEEREGEFFLAPEVLVGGWAKVFRKDRESPIVHRVKLSDWDTGRAFWKKSPAHMIAKVARAQCRHEAFPMKYRGLISEDELQMGAATDRPELAMPLSNAEAAALEGGGNGGQGKPESAAAPSQPAKGEGPESPSPPAADVPPTEPGPEEQAAIRDREQVEAGTQGQAPGPVPDRRKLWDAVLRKAKATHKHVNVLLKELTGKTGMPELTDPELVALAKKLEW